MTEIIPLNNQLKYVLILFNLKYCIKIRMIRGVEAI